MTNPRNASLEHGIEPHDSLCAIRGDIGFDLGCRQQQEIRTLETIRLKFLTRTEEWSTNVAKDALFHLGNGTVASKQDLLARMHQRVMEDSLEMSDTRFSQIGDAAIFSYVFRRTHHEGGSADTYQHIRRTLVYQRTGSSWQMIASAVQSFLLPIWNRSRWIRRFLTAKQASGLLSLLPRPRVRDQSPQLGAAV